MARKPTGNPNGRPKIVIDENTFSGLCAIQCTEEEIASVLGCSIDTINRWCKEKYGETFAETFKKKSAKGKMSLRRTQFKLAEKNASMAIFLGKQYLGQRDVIETNGESLDKVNQLLDKIEKEAKDDINE